MTGSFPYSSKTEFLFRCKIPGLLCRQCVGSAIGTRIPVIRFFRDS
jgi:hypothetical protein